MLNGNPQFHTDDQAGDFTMPLYDQHATVYDVPLVARLHLHR